MSYLAEREILISQAEKIMEEAQELLLEIMNDLVTANTQTSTVQEKILSHRYLDNESMEELIDSELSRHIKNLRSSISKAYGQHKSDLQNKLKTLIQIRATRQNRK